MGVIGHLETGLDLLNKFRSGFISWLQCGTAPQAFLPVFCPNFLWLDFGLIALDRTSATNSAAHNTVFLTLNREVTCLNYRA